MRGCSHALIGMQGGHAWTSGTRKADLWLPLKPAAAAPGLRSLLIAQPGSIPGQHDAPRGQQRSCAGASFGGNVKHCSLLACVRRA